MNHSNRLLSGFSNLNMERKLWISFSAIGVVVTFLAVTIASVFFNNSFEKSAIDTTIQAINQANATIDSNLQSARNIIDILSKNRQVLNLLLNAESTEIDEIVRDRISVGNYSDTIVESFPHFLGVALVGRNDMFVSNEMQRDVLTSLTDEQWYKDCINYPDKIFIVQKPRNRGISYHNPVSADEIIMVSRAVVHPTSGLVIGVIIIDLRYELLRETLENTKAGKDGFIMIFDNEGNRVYTPLNKIAYRVKGAWARAEEKQGINKTIDGEVFQLIYQTSEYTGWKTVGVFSRYTNLQEVRRFQATLIVVMMVAIALVILFSHVFATKITKPLRELRELIFRAEHGDLNVKFNVLHTDEIGQLGSGFNSMIDEMRELIETIYTQEEQKREDDIAFLQAQIKPHFLYNTFDTIHWLAKSHGADDIVKLISALTRLYRIGLSGGKDMITVKEEVEHVRSYLIIQQTRYSDILDYEISCSVEEEKLYVLKLILQPLVENAIYHGVRQKTCRGTVKVRIFEEDGTLFLQVIDDGPGISSTRLEQLEKQLLSESHHSGYGLYNVNKRIVLLHGEEYGISIQSTVNEGTVVTIKYPVLREENSLCTK